MKNNNKDKDESFIEENFAGSINQLKWHLIKEQLVRAQGIQVNDEEVLLAAKEMARAQFAQYGMSDVPDDYLTDYAKDLLQKKEYVDSIIDRTIDRQLTQAYKNVVKLDTKKVSLEEFRTLQ